jgi:uncharacterized protein (DUF924 family)
MSSDVERILSFWFEPKPRSADEVGARTKFWFNGGEAVDQRIREEFGPLVDGARKGQLDGWGATPRGTLALVILLDQFPRNLFRGSSEAFASDAKALALAHAGFESGGFSEFDPRERMFASLPFQHAEDLEAQRRAVSVAQQSALAAEPVWRTFFLESVAFARKHLDVIARFGRFPHRNAALGRTTTAAEQEYLDFLKFAEQWL